MTSTPPAWDHEVDVLLAGLAERIKVPGNASASVMGDEYAGAGATIGPAMAFACTAMRHAAARPAAD